ncbi:hypothetical protein [Variovorax sp. KK3]|uniref:hypothetical protein n=1 Tax=Variovorax sp. KK3 TaxID=1855728 RepID=UPI00097BFC55|nr:hypothetical protein [Variovorax sp. KK3]
MSSARVLMVSGLAALAIGFLLEGRLPARQTLLPALHADPAQTMVERPAFMVRAGGVDYRIAPLADYDITGLVVSRHDTSSWWNWIHAASNDHLNVADLCMIWGANAADGAYEKMSFSSGQFVCYVEGKDPAAFRPEYLRALSNNHLLTDNPAVARRLRSLRIGDQIRLRGQLASYSHNAGFAFTRGTSLVREDTGNGACETLFVRDIEVLRRAPAWPRWLAWLGALLVLAGLVRWYAAPHRPRS